MTRKTLKRDKAYFETLSDPRYWKCWRKRAFRSEEAARRALSERQDRPLVFSGLEVYACTEKTDKLKGHHYHLGHSRSQEVEKPCPR